MEITVRGLWTLIHGMGFPPIADLTLKRICIRWFLFYRRQSTLSSMTSNHNHRRFWSRLQAEP
jgi:hypothetical protein